MVRVFDGNPGNVQGHSQYHPFFTAGACFFRIMGSEQHRVEIIDHLAERTIPEHGMNTHGIFDSSEHAWPVHGSAVLFKDSLTVIKV